jgi:hypothetical protein
MKGIGQSKRLLIPLLVALAAAVLVIYTVARREPTPGKPTPAGTRDISQLIRSTHSPGRFSSSAPLSSGNRCVFGSGMTGEPKPDWTCTPGVLDIAVTGTTLSSTICRPGYDQQVLPPPSSIEAMRRAVFKHYGLPPDVHGRLGWLIPLSLGGANDVQNLWPMLEPQPATAKAGVDDELHRAVCAGRVRLADAQMAIITDWTLAERRLGLGGATPR